MRLLTYLKIPLETAMARMLGRSKSLRLKNSQKDLHQQEDSPAPPLTGTDSEPRNDGQSLKPAAHTTNPGKRVDTPDQVQRPRTSSRPGDRSRHFHKKGAPIAITSDDHTYNFPLPTPKTVLYTAEIHEDSTIGIALGSPTTPAHWNQNARATDFVTNQPGTTTQISYDNSFTDSSDTSHDMAKPKISRWRSLFGRKASHNVQQTPFYQLQQVPSGQNHVDSHSDVGSQRPHAACRSASRAALSPTATSEKQESRKRAKAAKKAAADQAKAKPKTENSTATTKSPILREGSPVQPPKDNWDSPANVPKSTVFGGSENNYPRTLGSGPMLDVDIPDIQMERYSVMFDSLLRSDQPSSLLLRRQANPERLKPLNKLSTKVGNDRDLATSQNMSNQVHRRRTWIVPMDY